METVRSVVEAYAAGQIVLDPLDKRTRKDEIRCAPSFVKGLLTPGAAHLYTAETVADFLGWEARWTASVLQSLELVEMRLLKESDFKGLSNKQARGLIEETHKAYEYRERLARAHEKAAQEEDLRGIASLARQT